MLAATLKKQFKAHNKLHVGKMSLDAKILFTIKVGKQSPADNIMQQDQYLPDWDWNIASNATHKNRNPLLQGAIAWPLCFVTPDW